MYGGFVYNNPEVEALYMSCNSTHARNSFGRQNYCERKPPKSWKDDFSVLSVLLLIYELEVQIKMHTDIAYVYMSILTVYVYAFLFHLWFSAVEDLFLSLSNHQIYH